MGRSRKGSHTRRGCLRTGIRSRRRPRLVCSRRASRRLGGRRCCPRAVTGSGRCCPRSRWTCCLRPSTRPPPPAPCPEWLRRASPCPAGAGPPPRAAAPRTRAPRRRAPGSARSRRRSRWRRHRWAVRSPTPHRRGSRQRVHQPDRAPARPARRSDPGPPPAHTRAAHRAHQGRQAGRPARARSNGRAGARGWGRRAPRTAAPATGPSGGGPACRAPRGPPPVPVRRLWRAAAPRLWRRCGSAARCRGASRRGTRTATRRTECTLAPLPRWPLAARPALRPAASGGTTTALPGWVPAGISAPRRARGCSSRCRWRRCPSPTRGRTDLRGSSRGARRPSRAPAWSCRRRASLAGPCLGYHGPARLHTGPATPRG
mmetsp:Transcript_7927/g.22286  ORF Transcript_7927/g.22286 Transcript_7927/m.22286 type:complete len:373 (-) Transcript_7927:573-1691(-)